MLNKKYQLARVIHKPGYHLGGMGGGDFRSVEELERCCKRYVKDIWKYLRTNDIMESLLDDDILRKLSMIPAYT